MHRHASLPQQQQLSQQPRAQPLQQRQHQQRQALQVGRSLLCIRGAPLAACTSGRGLVAAGPHRRWDPLQGAARGVQAKAALSAADGSGGNTAGEPEASWGKRLANFTDAFWKFLRPHTIRGTVLGTTAVTTRALLETPELIDWGLLPKALMGLLALLCGNGYIVGINQIYDVDIDVVNKPFLPIAAGQLSPGLAWVLCLSLASAGVGIVATHYGKLITSLYTFGLSLGTVYSVPPLRLKRFAVPAFLIIACVRGFLLNFGVYNATKAAIGAPASWSPAISFITVFVTVFAVVIAVTKDLPDVEGDLANGIETFATRMGVPAVSMGAVSLLLLNYGGAIWMALQPQLGFNPWVMAGGHAVLALALVWRAARLHQDKYTRDAIQSFYRWIWNLFYTEYALFPFL